MAEKNSSGRVARVFGDWYYKHEKDPTFDAENATDEQEADYEKILEEVMSKPQ